MTAPDFRDWVPPQGPVQASSGVLLQGGYAVPYQSPSIDTSNWGSVNIIVQPQNATASPYFGRIMWWDSIGGFVNTKRGWTFISGQPTGVAKSNGLAVTIPVYGDTAALFYDDNDPTATSFISVKGTTRSEEYVGAELPYEVGPIDYSFIGVSVPAGATQTLGYFGPYQNGAVISLTAPASCFLNVDAANFDNNAYGYRICNSLQGIGYGNTQTQCYAPGQAVRLNIHNGTSSAQSMSGSIQGY